MSDHVRLYDLIKESFILLDFGDRLFLEQFNLSVPRYYALTHIAKDPGITPSVLSRLMFCDKSNITRLVQGLLADGLVERRPHEKDGRAQRLYLTTNGDALHQQATEAHRAFIQQRLAVLEECAAGDMTNALTYLNRSLSEVQDNSSLTLLN